MLRVRHGVLNIPSTIIVAIWPQTHHLGKRQIYNWLHLLVLSWLKDRQNPFLYFEEWIPVSDYSTSWAWLFEPLLAFLFGLIRFCNFFSFLHRTFSWFKGQFFFQLFSKLASGKISYRSRRTWAINLIGFSALANTEKQAKVAAE